MDHRDLIEIAALVLSVLSSTVYLASRIQKIEDIASGTRDDLADHRKDDKEEFRRVYDRLDRKQDRSAGFAHDSLTI